MALDFLRGAILIVAVWVSWLVIFKIAAKSPLDNVPGPRPKRFSLFGDLLVFFDRHAWSFHKQTWSTFDSLARINSMFGDSVLYVYDPKALHHVIVKDQYIYEETPIFINLNRLLFGDSLLSTHGEKHKQQRKILNPVFTTNHLRSVVPSFYRIALKLRDALVKQIEHGQEEIDVLNWLTRTALELFGQGGLGHSFDSLDRDEKNPFVEVLKSLMPTFAPLFIPVQMIPLALRIAPPAFWRSIMECLPLQTVRNCLAIVDALDTTSKDILAKKKQIMAQGNDALEHEVGEGKDIMSVLLKANENASPDDKMSDAELQGHISSLIFAGMESTSGALAHILQLLSEHKDVQQRLREEIITARAGRDYIDFDELMALPYLEAVCRETLRLYSPVGHMLRQTTQNVVMPLSHPIRGNDGTMMSEIPLPKGSVVVIGILACNRSTSIWGPDADEWKPERWLNILPDSVTDARMPSIYSNLMTFLGGGRACIGFKFSQLEMKVVLSVLLEYLEFSPSDKEIYWNYSGIVFPSVGTTSTDPKLPLKVKLISKT